LDGAVGRYGRCTWNLRDGWILAGNATRGNRELAYPAIFLRDRSIIPLEIGGENSRKPI